MILTPNNSATAIKMLNSQLQGELDNVKQSVLDVVREVDNLDINPAVVMQLHSSDGMTFTDEDNTTNVDVTIYIGNQTYTDYTSLARDFGTNPQVMWFEFVEIHHEATDDAEAWDEGVWQEITSDDLRYYNQGFRLSYTDVSLTETTPLKCILTSQDKQGNDVISCGAQITLTILSEISQIDSALEELQGDYLTDIEDVRGNITGLQNDLSSTTEKLLQDIKDNSLIANGYAVINNGTLILGYNGFNWKTIIDGLGVSLETAGAVAGSFKQYKNASSLIADNARLSNVYFRSVSNNGELGLVAQSNGHVSFKGV